ncbi:hypothetical protein GQR58_022513 [Nymphon striatum]|nr:hypothetical protein GQR58_022513 [Nymphon striatum]
MNSYLHKLHQYCQTNQIQVNIKKSKGMIFSRKTPDLLKFKLIYDNHPLELVTTFKYLGILFDTKMNFKPHFQSLVEKCKFSFNSMLNSDIQLSHLNFNHIQRLIDARLISIINYGANIWGFKRVDKLECLIFYCIKRIFHLPKSTSSKLLKFQFGLSSIISSTLLTVLSYYIKLCNSLHPILKRCLISVTNQQTSSSWFKKFSASLSSYDIDPIKFLSCTKSVPTKVMKNSLKNHILELEKENLIKELDLKNYDPIILDYYSNLRNLLSVSSLPSDPKKIIIIFKTNVSFKLYLPNNFLYCFCCQQLLRINELLFHIVYECPAIFRNYYKGPCNSEIYIHHLLRSLSSYKSTNYFDLKLFACFVKYFRKKNSLQRINVDMLHTQVNLKAYGNKPINVIGQVNCNIEFHGKKSTQLFYVVKSTKVERAENNSYWRRDSRTLAAAEKRGLNVPDNCELKCQLKYYEIKFSCVKGGRGYTSSSTGKRPHQRYVMFAYYIEVSNNKSRMNFSTFRAGCQSFIQVTYSKERHKLVIVNLNLEHNHAVNLSFRINTMNENLMYTVKRCNIDKIAVQKHLKSKLVIENVNKTIKITYGCRGHVTSLFLSKGYQSDKCAKK